jgi:hypothetical protein
LASCINYPGVFFLYIRCRGRHYKPQGAWRKTAYHISGGWQELPATAGVSYRVDASAL